MSDDAQHAADCRQLLGDNFGYVHAWMDSCFREFGPLHRKVRHHAEGVHEAFLLFGQAGARAALVHILRDCLHLPRRSDYELQSVDPLGIPSYMSIADIVGFGEESFMNLAKQHLGLDQTADILIWGWLDQKDQIDQLLEVVTKDSSLYLKDVNERWDKVKEGISSSSFISSATDARYVDSDYADEVSDFAQVRTALEQRHGTVRFGFVKTTALINPLMIVDTEFAEFLRDELPDAESEASSVLFAFPPKVNVRVQALSDSRSATVITRFHQFSLSDVGSEIVDGSGIEVRFTVSPIPQLIIVTECEGRFYLKAGMHRALVLAQAGYVEIPCFVICEDNAPAVSGPYPTYSQQVLKQKRPPLLLDALEQSFTSRIKYRRTNRVLRIAAEDFFIPVE